MKNEIFVKGAREHNLKNIDVRFPRDKFVVITGLSGSGKSSLAFDTIYNEGNRRYVESLSSYARQFLGNSSKPDVDSIEGLSPSISIEQKTTSKNPRSTVATVTEIYDYLRLLFARVGISYCPKCNSKIEVQSNENILNQIFLEKGKERIFLCPIVRGLKGTYEKLFSDLLKEGFVRIRVDGQIYRLDTIKDELKLKRYEKHWIEIVIDRTKILEENRSEISNSIEICLSKSKGLLIILDEKKQKELEKKFKKITEKELKEIQRKCEKLYSNFGMCPNHADIVFEKLEPKYFSFNSPFGACNSCLGIGDIIDFDENLIIPNKNLSIADGAVKIWGSKVELTWQIRGLKELFKKYKFDVFTPIKKLDKKSYDALMQGDKQIVRQRVWNGNMEYKPIYEGIIPQYKRLHRQTESNYRREHFEKFMDSKKCETCQGKKLKDNILSVKINKKSIMDICDFSIKEAVNFFKTLNEKLSKTQVEIGEQILKEIKSRLQFLNDVGLSYLTLSRSSKTLSGGESQRIRLATQIGTNLRGVLYVLDEPSIGLHQKDNHKLIRTLKRLRDIGNSLLVVEHDEDTIKEADFLIDMGPGAGINGGKVVAQGSVEEVKKNPKSLTGKYLSKKTQIKPIENFREPKDFIKLRGAKDNNLKNVDVDFPTQVLCGICGLSGSGKSTLLNQTLSQLLKEKFGQEKEFRPNYKSIHIPKEIKNIIVIDQSPIGRTPRSNPATYIKVFDEIRNLFSQTKLSKQRGYKAGRFSFNTKGGRCEKCQGDGTIKIEMNFLPDVYIKCDECKGHRYNKETLEITFKEKNISQILEMDVEEAVKFFENIPLIHRKIKTLQDVGLGYIKLGQSSTTLSGGESQRIKLTKELSKVKKGDCVYILDEPTTGLHFEDIKKLLKILNKLVDKGNSIYVIEHNLDVLKSCDYILEMGQEGGDKGGQLITKGTPKEISQNKTSPTGVFLKKYF